MPQGQFTVLSLSGAILHEIDDETAGQPKAFLSASLANPAGGVVGGTVAGILQANGVVTVRMPRTVFCLLQQLCCWAPLDNSSLEFGDDS